MSTESMQLTNEQKLKIFMLYAGNKYTPYADSGAFFPIEARSIHKIELILDMGSEPLICLWSLQDISDEDAIEVAKMMDWYSDDFNITEFKKVFCYRTINDVRYYVHQYLIQRGYAVPLFIEPNHPANGRTAIELNLAIDKSKPSI